MPEEVNIIVEETIEEVTIDVTEVIEEVTIITEEGVKGADGNTIISEPRDPELTDGKPSDWFINEVSLQIWGPKTATSWGDGKAMIPYTGSVNEKNVITVNIADELGAPIGDYYFLAPNTTYQWSGVVDLGGKGIVVGLGTKVQGNNMSSDIMFTTFTGDVVVGATGINLEKITVNAPNSSQIFDCIDDKSNPMSRFSIEQVGLIGPNLGDIQDMYGIYINKVFGMNFTNGFNVFGTGNFILVKNYQGLNFTGTALDLNTSTYKHIEIKENTASTQASGVFLEVAPNGANLLNSGEGSIVDNKIDTTAGGDAIIGYTPFDVNWISQFNDGILPSDRLVPQGWGQYSDSANVNQVFGNTFQKLSIDNDSIIDSKLPKSISEVRQFWDSSRNTLDPITSGDTYDVRIIMNMIATSSNPNFIELVLDIGNDDNAITIPILNTAVFLRSATSQSIMITFPIYALDTFLANGGRFWLRANSGTVTVSDRNILIERKSSGAR